eukprot:gene4466-14842_t
MHDLLIYDLLMHDPLMHDLRRLCISTLSVTAPYKEFPCVRVAQTNPPLHLSTYKCKVEKENINLKRLTTIKITENSTCRNVSWGVLGGEQVLVAKP